MKTHFIISIGICLLSLSSTMAHARVSKQYMKWARGEFEIPLEIKEVKTVSELQPFLQNNREFTRMSAVRRLGEIEGPKAIAHLRTVFAKEPAHKGMHSIPMVKFEVIRTLEKIGTEQAKSALLGILNDYWKRGPKVKNKKAFRLDRDFATVMPLLLKTSYRWSEEENVFKTVETIANSEDVNTFYMNTNGIGQRAWEAYLKGKMIREGITEEKDTAVYLLDFMEGVSQPIRPRTLNAVKRYAAHNIFEKHSSESTLTSLLRETKEELSRQISLLEPEIASERNLLVKRLHQLSNRRNYINKLLKNKQKKQ